MAALLNRLEAARKQHVQEQMPGAVAAIMALLDFLKAEGATPGQCLPLAWLANDLTSTTIGKPMFEAGQWAIAAAAVDVLKLTGMAVPEACRRVARSTGGALDGKQLADWRKNVRGKKARPDAVDHYHHAVRELTAYLNSVGLDKNRWERPLLAMVADTFGSKKE
jgi:hypothetical protein